MQRGGGGRCSPDNDDNDVDDGNVDKDDNKYDCSVTDDNDNDDMKEFFTRGPIAFAIDDITTCRPGIIMCYDGHDDYYAAVDTANDDDDDDDNKW